MPRDLATLAAPQPGVSMADSPENPPQPRDSMELPPQTATPSAPSMLDAGSAAVLQKMDEANRLGAQPMLREIGEFALNMDEPNGRAPEKQGEKAGTPRLDLFGDAKHFESFLRDKTSPPNIGALATKDKPVVFLGEEHTDATSQRFIADQAKSMRDAGITHFGVELSSTLQPLLDGMFKGDKEARNAFEKELQGADKNHPGISKRYMEILDSMVANGIKPVALDTFHERPIDIQSDGFKVRNEHAAKLVAEIIKSDPNARIVALGGSDHSGSWGIDPLEKQLKQNHGINSTVVHLAGGDQRQRYFGVNLTDQQQDRERAGEKLTRFAQHNKIDKPFLAPVDPDKGSADMLLYVPPPKRVR